jgi:hypothetical protein
VVHGPGGAAFEVLYLAQHMDADADVMSEPQFHFSLPHLTLPLQGNHPTVFNLSPTSFCPALLFPHPNLDHMFRHNNAGQCLAQLSLRRAAWPGVSRTPLQSSLGEAVECEFTLSDDGQYLVASRSVSSHVGLPPYRYVCAASCEAPRRGPCGSCWAYFCH